MLYEVVQFSPQLRKDKTDLGGRDDVYGEAITMLAEVRYTRGGREVSTNTEYPTQDAIVTVGRTPAMAALKTETQIRFDERDWTIQDIVPVGRKDSYRRNRLEFHLKAIGESDD